MHDLDVELARAQWQDGLRRVERERANPDRYRLLMLRVDVVANGLRRRVGQTFTVAELAAAYDGADEWAQALIDDADPEAPPALEPGTVADAAFGLYVRGAVDYRP